MVVQSCAIDAQPGFVACWIAAAEVLYANIDLDIFLVVNAIAAT